MVSINDYPDIHRVFGECHFEEVDVCYSTANRRQGAAGINGERVVVDWKSDFLEGLFGACGGG